MSWPPIIHGTIYSYKATVHFGPHRLVLRPARRPRHTRRKMHLEIVPELSWNGAAISSATPWPPLIF